MAQPGKSTEAFTFEQIEYGFDLPADLGQHPLDGEKRDEASLAEQYAAGELVIEAHLRWQGHSRGGHFSYGRAIFYGDGERLMTGDEWWPHPLEAFFTRHASMQPDFTCRLRGPYRNDKSVLVDTVEVVERIKNVVPVTIRPSLVWLQSFDDAHGLITYARKTDDPLLVEVFPRIVDGELGSLVGSVPGSEHKRPNDVVKHRTKVVDDVAQNAGHLIGDGGVDVDFEEYLSLFRLLVGFETIWFSAYPGIRFAPEIIHVVFRPLEFYSSAGQSVDGACNHE